LANPINPYTGKPYRGNVSEERVRNDYERYEQEYGDGNAVVEFDDGNSRNDDNRNREQPETGKKRFTLGKEKITVEKPEGKPEHKPYSEKTQNKKKQDPITAHHVESWLVQGFAFAAMMRNSEWWAIKHPEIEVRPWAGSAAELLNKIPIEHAERLTEIKEKYGTRAAPEPRR
jgi:hypothetical protein